MRTIRSTLAIFAFHALVWHAPAQAELVDLVPQQAKAYLHVGDLTKAEKNILDFTQAAGIPLPPQFKLQHLSNISGLGDQWELERGIGLAVIEPTDQGAVLLVPVKDSATALRLLNAKPDGKYHSVTVSNMSLVALEKEKCLVLAFDKNFLKIFEAPETTLTQGWSDDQKKLLAEADVLIHVNVPAFKPFIDQGLGMARLALGQVANFAPQNMPDANPEMTVQTLNWYLDGIAKLLDQTDAVDLGFDIQADHVKLVKTVTFRSDSQVQQTLSKVKGNADAYLATVPSGQFLMAGAMNINGLQPVFLDMFESMWSLKVFSDKIENIEEKKQAALALYEQLTGWSMTFDLANEGLTAQGMYFVKDPQAARKQIRDSFDFGIEITKAASPFKMETSMTTKQVGGKVVEEMTMDYSKAPDEMRTVIAAMYGGEKLITQIGILGKGLGFAMGTSGDPFTKISESPKPLTGDVHVSAAMAMLPSNPQAVLLIDPIGGFRMVKRMSVAIPAMPAMPFLDNLPKEATVPVAMAWTSNDGNINVHLIVPAATIKQIIQTVRP